MTPHFESVIMEIPDTFVDRVRETMQLQRGQNRIWSNNSPKRLFGSEKEQRLLYWELSSCVRSNPRVPFLSTRSDVLSFLTKSSSTLKAGHHNSNQHSVAPTTDAILVYTT